MYEKMPTWPKYRTYATLLKWNITFHFILLWWMKWKCSDLKSLRTCCIKHGTKHTRGVQKVRRLTQLTTRYSRHILSLFNIDTCNWNALGPAFLQSSDTVVEELLFPAICHAIRTRMANTVGDGVVQSRHFEWQPVLELTCDQIRCLGSN